MSENWNVVAKVSLILFLFLLEFQVSISKIICFSHVIRNLNFSCPILVVTVSVVLLSAFVISQKNDSNIELDFEKFDVPGNCLCLNSSRATHYSWEKCKNILYLNSSQADSSMIKHIYKNIYIQNCLLNTKIISFSGISLSNIH